MPATTWPRAPYPSNVATHPLLVVDYLKIQSSDAAVREAETRILEKACTELGFFYLKNHGIEPEKMFAVGEETFALPTEELLKFEQGDGGMSAGYKRAGANGVDKLGNLDTIQFINVNKSDALDAPTVRMRTYPPTIHSNMPTVTEFVDKSDTVLLNLMISLEPFLDLAPGTFAKLHPRDLATGSEARIIFKPAAGTKGAVPEGVGEDGLPASAIGAHTDFGSFSLLHGRGTGGLQVLPPGTTVWQNIKPLEGHAVCNVGDTLSVFSGGILRSNIHRVVPPPGDQALFTRWSLVYFLRPYFDAELYPLSSASAKIASAAAVNPAMKVLERGTTAGEWFKRRILNQRTANRKGEETWAQSRGTEHTPLAT